jgi:hypothetical protein
MLDLDGVADGPIMPNGQGGATADEPIRPATPPKEAPEVSDEIKPEEPKAPIVPDPDDEPIVPPTDAPAPVELADEAEIKIGNDTFKVKDLLQGQLAHADYTRKTQELARERDEMREFRLETELNDLQTEDFVRRMDDPNEMINEFAVHKPEVWEAVEQYVIDRAIHLQGLTPEGRELFLHKEQEARARWKSGREQKMTQTFTQHKTKAQARIEAQKNHGNWRSEAMKAAGLSLTKSEHTDLLMDGMTSARNRGKAWTKELFDAEAARVAKAFGVKAPKPPKPAPGATAPAAPPPAKLPPVRSPGNAPVAKTQRKAKDRDMGSFFDRIRSGE